MCAKFNLESLLGFVDNNNIFIFYTGVVAALRVNLSLTRLGFNILGLITTGSLYPLLNVPERPFDISDTAAGRPKILVLSVFERRQRRHPDH